MTTLVNLTATKIDRDWSEGRKAVTAIHHEISPGVFIHVGLGAQGLQVFHNDRRVGIPLAELVKLVRAHDPLIGAQDASAKPVT